MAGRNNTETQTPAEEITMDIIIAAIINNTINTLVSLIPTGAEGVDSRTHDWRYSCPEGRFEYATTQYWRWDADGERPAGDAIVWIVNSPFGGTDAYTAVRFGGEINTYRGSVAAALGSLGFTTKVAPLPTDEDLAA